jgi:hypothetical protein
VESSCELGNEPSGSIKCWELPSGCTTCGLSSGTQLHRVSYLVIHGRTLLTADQPVPRSLHTLRTTDFNASSRIRTHDSDV